MHLHFPSWHDLDKKTSEFEQKVAEKIGDIKAGHPLAAATINALLALLPPPLDAIASNIYYSFDPTYPDRTDEVLKYIDQLRKGGEENYNKITSQLEEITGNLDPKTITENQSTLQIIQEILISSGKDTNQKLDLLKNDLTFLKERVNDLEQGQQAILQGQQELVSKLSSTLSIIDKVSSQLNSFGSGQASMMGTGGGAAGGGDVPHYGGGPPTRQPSVVSVREGNTINFKKGDQVVETITSDDLEKLDPDSKKLIGSLEQSMEQNFNLWTAVYPSRNASVDPVVNAKVELQLNEIAKKMCADLNNILNFLSRIGKQLHDHYDHIRFICDGIQFL